jgi:hypothetical protein
MDCGVCVFGELLGLTREEIIFDIPDAVKGITDKQWEAYFNVKGLEMVRHQPGEERSPRKLSRSTTSSLAPPNYRRCFCL